MHALLVLPLIIPLATGALGLLALHRVPLQRAIGVAGAATLFAAAIALFVAVYRHGPASTQLGAWPAPFGITLYCDLFSAVMLLLAGAMAVAISLYSLASIDVQRISFGYFPLVQVLLMGVCGALLTGDIFNLFVWFEVMLLSSFVLLVLGGERRQVEGAVKYVTINLISSMLFLSAIGVLYGKTGALNMAHLALTIPESESPELLTVVFFLFLTSFGIKSAMFPLFFWLPASYHTAPIAITALFSGLLTKVGVYALIRLSTLVFTQEPAIIRWILIPLAALTMICGVLGAIAQTDVRRLLAFHIVSQIGYLLMGLALGSALALASAIFFMIHVVISKAALFLIAGIVHRHTGSYDLKKLGGLYDARPMLGILFLVPALSLAGIPPLAGFFGKLGLVRAGLEAGEYALVAAALVVSILTFYSMIKIWNEAFWKAPPDGASHSEEDDAPGPAALLYAPVIVLALALVVLGVAAEPAFAVAVQAAGQLLDPDAYVAAVWGDTR